MFKTGDTVFHAPSGETWLVAYCEDGRVCACGWPETLARVTDCVLKRSATEDQRRKLLLEMEADGGSRGAYARRIVEQEGIKMKTKDNPCY